MSELQYRIKNKYLYFLIGLKKEVEYEVFVFPLEQKYATFKDALEACMVFKIENIADFEAFDHLLAVEGTYLYMKGYFLKEKTYKEMERMVMQNLSK